MTSSLLFVMHEKDAGTLGIWDLRPCSYWWSAVNGICNNLNSDYTHLYIE